LISDWFRYNRGYGEGCEPVTGPIEQITTDSGKALLYNNVDALVGAMAAFAPPAPGQTTLPDEYEQALNSIIATNWT
jgi:hypothetical protein